MDYVALKAEIQNDPVPMGYAPLIAAGDDAGIADLLNSRKPPGAAVITLDVVDQSRVLPLALTMMKSAAVLADANKKTRWVETAKIFVIAPSIPTAQAQVTQTFQDAVTDGVLTQQQLNGLRQRTGSRAEVLFGQGVAVTADDVYTALRG